MSPLADSTAVRHGLEAPPALGEPSPSREGTPGVWIPHQRAAPTFHPASRSTPAPGPVSFFRRTPSASHWAPFLTGRRRLPFSPRSTAGRNTCPRWRPFRNPAVARTNGDARCPRCAETRHVRRRRAQANRSAPRRNGPATSSSALRHAAIDRTGGVADPPPRSESRIRRGTTRRPRRRRRRHRRACRHRLDGPSSPGRCRDGGLPCT